MKILVTGGAGFIGSNFVHYWLKNNPEDTIVNVDKLTYAGNVENLAALKGNTQHEFVKADICDGDAMDRAMNGVDTVVHFAAESHVDRSIMDSDPFVQTNVLGTNTLLKTALKHNVKRFHHISTDEVFGALTLESKEKFSESTPYNPHSPYSASKAGSDHLVRAFSTTYGLPITISNCGNNYGPYHFPEKLIPLAITNVLEGKKVPVYGDGLNVRDWLYVEDHCRAIEMILKKGTVGETYLIGGLTDAISNLQVVRELLKLLGKDESSIEFVKDRPGHDRRYDVDWSKIKRELGWEPNYTFSEALAATVEWYKTNTDWWQHIKSGAYKDYYSQQYSK